MVLRRFWSALGHFRPVLGSYDPFRPFGPCATLGAAQSLLGTFGGTQKGGGRSRVWAPTVFFFRLGGPFLTLPKPNFDVFGHF